MRQHVLSERWASFEDRVRALRPAAEVFGHSNAYAGGYLLTDDSGPLSFDLPQGWACYRFAGYRLYASPGTPVHLSGEVASATGALVIGRILDSDRPSESGAEIAGRIATLASTEGASACDQYISWLSGRYVIVLSDGKSLHLYGDATNSLSCFWPAGQAVFCVSSHSALVAAVAGPFESTEQRWVMAHPDYDSPGGKYLPALVTPYDGVDQLYANCKAEFSSSGVKVSRFFPFASRTEMPTDEAYDLFVSELRTQVRFWLSQADVSVLGLTAGGDARAVLTSSLDAFQDAGSIAMTYHFFDRNPATTHNDLLAANRLAVAACLPHMTLDIAELSASSPFTQLYTSTFPVGARFPSLAASLYEGLPAGAAFFISLGGEVGTGFYRERDEATISPELLARKYTTSRFSADPRLIEKFEDYIDVTDFHEDRLMGYSFYDMFYWEHRLSKWAALGYSEYDLSCVPAVPMNSRRFFAAMHAIPESERLSGYFYSRLLADSGVTSPLRR